MYYARHTPSGLFRQGMILIGNSLVVFGTLSTRKSKVLFYHQSKNQEFRNQIIQKRGIALEIR
jgi:hypothetical protein